MKMIKTKIKQMGFAILEVMLAVIVIGLSTGGGYLMYQYVLTQQKNDKTSNEIISMASVFSDLYLAHLTSTLATAADLVTLFSASDRFDPNFFKTTADSSLQMLSPYGPMAFTITSGPTPGSAFSVTVPVSEDTDAAKNQVCDPVINYVKSCAKGSGASVIVNIVANE